MVSEPTDTSREAVEQVIDLLLQTDKTKHGYYGYVAFNRDGRSAAATLLALLARTESAQALVAEFEAAITRREDMHECAMQERDDATLYADEQKARAKAAEAKARESALQELASLGQASEAYEAQLRAEAERDALQAENVRLRDALEKMHHAVCGETGFANRVRMDSGKAYPWEALDLAEEKAAAALAALECQAMNQAAITALIAAIEAGDEQWVHLPRIPEIHTDLVWKAHQESLDAALALHEALLPGWWCELRYSTRPRARIGFTTLLADCQDDNLARAWLIAILKAYQAQTAGSAP